MRSTGGGATMRSRISRYDKRFFGTWEAFADCLQETFKDREDVEELTKIELRQLRYSIAVGAVGILLQNLNEQALADEFHALSEALLDLADGVSSPLFRVA